MSMFDPDDARFKQQGAGQPSAAPTNMPATHGAPQAAAPAYQQYHAPPPQQYHAPPPQSGAPTQVYSDGQRSVEQSYPPASAYQQPQYSAPPQAYAAAPTTPVKPAHAAGGLRPSGWSTGLYDCFDDVGGDCIVALLCPCCSHGTIASLVQGGGQCEGCCAFYCLQHFGTFTAGLLTGCVRQELRRKYNLAEDPCGDMVAGFFCPWCAICQVQRELKYRGIGVPQPAGHIAMGAPAHQTMTA